MGGRIGTSSIVSRGVAVSRDGNHYVIEGFDMDSEPLHIRKGRVHKEWAGNLITSLQKLMKEDTEDDRN